MKINFRIDDPLSHFLSTKGGPKLFKKTIGSIAKKFSLVATDIEDEAQALFFFTKGKMSKAEIEKMRVAKKRKILVSLLSCQYLIFRHPDNYMKYICPQVESLLIGVLAQRLEIEDARSVVIRYRKGIFFKDDPQVLVATKRLGKKRMKEIYKKFNR